jgi:hypothetical protein
MALGRFAYTIKASNHSFNVFDAIFDTITGKNRGYDPAGISLARARDPENPYIRPRSVLSQVANAAAAQAQTALFRQGSRLNPAPVPQPVSQTFAATGPSKLEPLVQEGTQTMSLDLGNLLGNLGSQYISARWGTPRQPQVMAPTIRPQGPRAGVAAQPVLLETLPEMAGRAYDYLFTDEQAQQLSQLPNAPTGAPMTNGCTPPSYCVDGKTGKVTIKQKRRRRRRLATSSDIRDLSSLKSVLSPADLKMWIATHPS